MSKKGLSGLSRDDLRCDKAAAKIEELIIGRWPGRKQPLLTARIGGRHMVIARFPSVDRMKLFAACLRRGLEIEREGENSGEKP